MSPVRMQRVESGVRTIIALTEAINRHDLAAIMGLVSDDCIFESRSPAPDGTLYKGKESIAQYWQELFKQLPNASLKIEDIFGFGLRCVMLWRISWTDNVGNELHIRGVDICRVKDTAINEVLSYIKG